MRAVLGGLERVVREVCRNMKPFQPGDMVCLTLRNPDSEVWRSTSARLWNEKQNESFDEMLEGEIGIVITTGDFHYTELLISGEKRGWVLKDLLEVLCIPR